MTRFKSVWKCWTCGWKLDSGEQLDCITCEEWMWSEIRRQDHPISQPRIVAQVVDYAESEGVIALLRKELEGIII